MKRYLLPLFSIFVLSFFIASCTGYSEKEKKTFDTEIQAFLKKSNLKLSKTSSGVYYKIVKKGEGKTILYGDKIRVMYKGKNMDGLIFDEKNTPIIYELKNLIPAWKEILVGQKTGSVFYIATPPQMGYGNEQAGEIPPNSCLFFDIKVMESL